MEGSKQLNAALREWFDAHKPGADNDISHGGPGQPISGVGNDPEGEPGGFEP